MAQSVRYLHNYVELSLDELQEYPGNPRRGDNPRYQEIKHSIRSCGLLNPLVVTRRSTGERYMLCHGGGTRLRILRELWQETGARRFFHFRCLLLPWQEEAHTLSTHLMENELRANLRPIDKAAAIVRLRSMLEKQQGKRLSLRKLATALARLGWKVDFSDLSKLIFAHEELLPLIPRALAGGMGLNRIQRLRRMYRAYRQFWQQRGRSVQSFLPCWRSTLQHHDDEEYFDCSACETCLSGILAEHLDTFGSTVRAEVHCLGGNSATPALPNAVQTPIPQYQPEEQADNGARQEQAPSKGATAAAGAPPSPCQSLHTQRQRSYRLCAELARRAGLGELFAPSPTRGYGFRPSSGEGFSPAELNRQQAAFYYYLEALSGWPRNASHEAAERHNARCAAELMALLYQERTAPDSKTARSMAALEEQIARLRARACKIFGCERSLWKKEES